MKTPSILLFTILFFITCAPEGSHHAINQSKASASLITLKDSLPTPTLSMDSIQYDFIAYDKNKIQSATRLSHFFQQLKKLEKGQVRQVRIAHIGDSHIQADFIPGKIKYLLQSKFGNAGRGLIFPYKQAGTHSPIDFKTESDASFDHKRSVFQKGGPSIGISGIGIESKSGAFEIFMYQKERYGVLQGFNQVSIFREPSDSLFDISLESDSQVIFSQKSKHTYCDIFQSDQEVISTRLKVGIRQDDQARLNIHGLLLENTFKPGILYNMMGVNGTTYFHFNRCEYLLPELSLLNPDLVIISLGTNEALTRDFTPAKLKKEAGKFLSNLRESCPQSSILITTLPDAWQKKQVPNPHVEPAKNALISLAEDFGTGLWNLHEVMGGQGAMKHWVDAQLGYVDYIHFTQMGYELQADLLYTALIEAYDEYR